MNIKKIEQEANWFMGDKDNQQHLAEYVPDLLAEVKRLRGIIDYIRDTGKMDRNPSGHLLSIMEKVLTTEEYLDMYLKTSRWINYARTEILEEEK